MLGNLGLKATIPLGYFLAAQSTSLRCYFLLCTFAATFNRSAFNRMNPVASSWL
jgi:hypothetical protein